MPKDMLCIGLVADGIEVTRYNTASIETDEIQIYPSGAELLYQASGESRWITFVLPQHVLQSVAVAQNGRPLDLHKRDARSIRPIGMPPGRWFMNITTG